MLFLSNDRDASAGISKKEQLLLQRDFVSVFKKDSSETDAEKLKERREFEEFVETAGELTQDRKLFTDPNKELDLVQIQKWFREQVYMYWANRSQFSYAAWCLDSEGIRGFLEW